jgi:hypothetical protein
MSRKVAIQVCQANFWDPNFHLCEIAADSGGGDENSAEVDTVRGRRARLRRGQEAGLYRTGEFHLLLDLARPNVAAEENANENHGREQNQRGEAADDQVAAQIAEGDRNAFLVDGDFRKVAPSGPAGGWNSRGTNRFGGGPPRRKRSTDTTILPDVEGISCLAFWCNSN